MINFNPSQTLVITDFDGTLIKKEVDGKKVPSLISLLIDEKYLGKAGVQQAHDLFQHYLPIELDPSIDPIKKQQLMQEWWEKSYVVMIKAGVTKQMIKEICSSKYVQLRDGVREFLSLMAKSGIKVIIFSSSSAGGYSIKYLLQLHQFLTDNVSIVSNQLEFNQQGLMTGYKKPIIHISNKTAHTLYQNQVLDQNKLYKQCLLIGDSPDDALMANGLNCQEVFKVVFADDCEHYQQLFDHVLPVEGGFGEIIELFQAK